MIVEGLQHHKKRLRELLDAFDRKAHHVVGVVSLIALLFHQRATQTGIAQVLVGLIVRTARPANLPGNSMGNQRRGSTARQARP